LGGLAGAALVALGAQAAGNGLVVSGAWMRSIIPSRPAAGYFVLANRTDAARKLVKASSPACGMLMLHRSVNRNGVDRMEMVESVDVPAHGQVAFAPGGYHLMCTSPSKELAKGRKVAVTLYFDNGESVTSEFPVRGAAGK
jgi:copper(I)-binding protein